MASTLNFHQIPQIHNLAYETQVTLRELKAAIFKIISAQNPSQGYYEVKKEVTFHLNFVP